MCLAYADVNVKFASPHAPRFGATALCDRCRVRLPAGKPDAWA